MSWFYSHYGPEIYTNSMNTPPQAVTERYVSNLIHLGSNKEFNLSKLTQQPSVVSGETVGHYYEAVVGSQKDYQIGRGATVSQAVRRALIKHGVTFR